jgi:hypothetical protein
LHYFKVNYDLLI